MSGAEISFGARQLNDGINFRASVLSSYKIAAAPTPVFVPYVTREGSIFIADRYEARQVVIAGSVLGYPKYVLETNRDELILDLLKGEQNLKLGYEDLRYWTARVSGEIKQSGPTLPHVWLYQATFELANPFANAYSANADVVNNSALTLVSGTEYSKTFSVPVGGTAFNRPVFTVVVPAGGPYGLTSIWVENLSTGMQTNVSRTWAALDSLVIDTNAFTVKVNGTSVDMTGSFPVLDPTKGDNTIVIHGVASSAPTLNVTIASRSRYA